jgi:hypothetical protein
VLVGIAVAAAITYGFERPLLKIDPTRFKLVRRAYATED